MYKEAITGEFICGWQYLLWTTKTWRYSILSPENWKLLEAETDEIYANSFDCISDNNLSDIVFRCALDYFNNTVAV